MIDMQGSLEDQPLGFLLSRAANVLRAEVTATVLNPLDVGFQQYLCMRMLSRHPGRSNAELARDFNVSPQAMNIVLRGLEERGLVSRPASVAAGRSLPAELTRGGRDLLARTDSGVRAAESAVLGALSEEQRRSFKRILAAIGSGPDCPDGFPVPRGATVDSSAHQSVPTAR